MSLVDVVYVWVLQTPLIMIAQLFWGLILAFLYAGLWARDRELGSAGFSLSEVIKKVKWTLRIWITLLFPHVWSVYKEIQVEISILV